VKRRLGTRMVNPVGLGCMGLSHGYSTPPSPAAAARLLHRALDLGYDHLDTARVYGRGQNEALIGEALAGRRGSFVLASKCGLVLDANKRGADGSPEAIRAAIEQSLRLLRTDHIDLYYLHRRDFDVPIAESVGAMADLVAEGKIGGVGLSEMSAQTLRMAHAVHPITAMQSEYSLWTRNPEIAVLDACRELGVTFVAFSPVGRGVLANGLRDPGTLPGHDIRRGQPRFNAENWPGNLALVDGFNAIATEAGLTPAQLALAWLLSRGEHVVAIPGTTKETHLAENIARTDWPPDPAIFARLETRINQRTVSGPRYPAAMQATIETEEFS
jgi:aryl-alcohol dehydrogenase-like predicted oxidoreductase